MLWGAPGRVTQGVKRDVRARLRARLLALVERLQRRRQVAAVS